MVTKGAETPVATKLVWPVVLEVSGPAVWKPAGQGEMAEFAEQEYGRARLVVLLTALDESA